MAAQPSITRRHFLSSAPLAAAGAAVSVAALAGPVAGAVLPSEELAPLFDARQRFDFAIALVVEAMNELAGDADGWRVTIGMMGGTPTVMRHAIRLVDEPMMGRNVGTGRMEPLLNRAGRPIVFAVDRSTEI